MSCRAASVPVGRDMSEGWKRAQTEFQTSRVERPRSTTDLTRRLISLDPAPGFVGTTTSRPQRRVRDQTGRESRSQAWGPPTRVGHDLTAPLEEAVGAGSTRCRNTPPIHADPVRDSRENPRNPARERVERRDQASGIGHQVSDQYRWRSDGFVGQLSFEGDSGGHRGAGGVPAARVGGEEEQTVGPATAAPMG